MGLNWHPLQSSRKTWENNLEALRGCDFQLAGRIAGHTPLHPWFVTLDGTRLLLGNAIGDQVVALPNSVNEQSARDIAHKLYPADQCTEPVMIAGLDQGWLWDRVYQLPCHTPLTPGHRPPLYFLARDIDRLWAVMHLHDWTKLLADSRVRLFVGDDAVEQCRISMIECPQVPWAKLCVTVDPSIWPARVTIDSIWQQAHQAMNTHMEQLSRRVETLYAGSDIKTIARRLRGEKLRVMGITSHYTTFLKYSMSDWLDAFIGTGHDTLMVIERGDHEINTPLNFSQAVTNFRPDLILMIDHYRAEIPGLPRQVPCIMWVQRQLPNIFSTKAGAAQGPMDFCLGYGRMSLPLKYGYPAQRFCAARVGVNENRFTCAPISESALDPYRCEVSYVSHAAESAESIVESQLQKQQPQGRRLLLGTFEQMKAHYARSAEVLCGKWIGRMFEQSMRDCRLTLEPGSIGPIIDFFTHRVNNAMFRHQSLQWLVELGVDLHLYGREWEKHPRLSRFARGIADNVGQLRAICQASKINLQVQPFGNVHQRLLDGLMCGGFFLVRDSRTDRVGRLYEKLWSWCGANGITSDVQLSDALSGAIDDEIRQTVDSINHLEGHRWGPRDYPPLFDTCSAHAETGFSSAADSLWGDDYDKVAFSGRDQLRQKMEIFLGNPSLRRSIAESMRHPILSRCTYTAISRRMLDMVADQLAPMAQFVRSAA